MCECGGSVSRRLEMASDTALGGVACAPALHAPAVLTYKRLRNFRPMDRPSPSTSSNAIVARGKMPVEVAGAGLETSAWKGCGSTQRCPYVPCFASIIKMTSRCAHAPSRTCCAPPTHLPSASHGTNALCAAPPVPDSLDCSRTARNPLTSLTAVPNLARTTGPERPARP